MTSFIASSAWSEPITPAAGPRTPASAQLVNAPVAAPAATQTLTPEQAQRALETLQDDYAACWTPLEKAFTGTK